MEHVLLDDAVLEYLQSKGMHRAVAELNEILKHEACLKSAEQQPSLLTPTKKTSTLLKDRISQFDKTQATGHLPKVESSSKSLKRGDWTKVLSPPKSVEVGRKAHPNKNETMPSPPLLWNEKESDAGNPADVDEVETCQEEHPDARVDGSEENATKPARRSWTAKRVIDVETYKKENPEKSGKPNSAAEARRARIAERLYNFEVDESTHTNASENSAASTGLEGRVKRRRSKSASTLQSRSLHVPRKPKTLSNGKRKNEKKNGKKIGNEWNKVVGSVDDSNGGSLKSTISDDLATVATPGVNEDDTKRSDGSSTKSFDSSGVCDNNSDSAPNQSTDTEGASKRTWKVKRVMNVEEFGREEESKDVFQKHLTKFQNNNKHVVEKSLSEELLCPSPTEKKTANSSSVKPYLPIAIAQNVKNVPNRKMDEILFIKNESPNVPSLKDRIGMFSKHQTQPHFAAQAKPPSFLSAKHMKKLVAKQELPSTKESGQNCDRDSRPPKSPRKNAKYMPAKAAIKNGLVLPEPSIKDLLPPPKKSLDATKDDKKEKRADIHDRRARLRKSKSALLGQKSASKKDVFLPVSAKPVEDLSSFKLPEFPKDVESIKVIKAALRNNFVFDMEEDEIDKFVKAFEHVVVGQGEIIIRQGDVGDFFYVIAYGTVSFQVNGKKVSTIGQGKTFGEMSLLYTCPRAATVIAEHQSTRLFRIDQKSFRFVMQTQTKESEEKKESLLRGIPFLKHLSKEDLNRLSSVMTPCLFEIGDYIVKMGERGDSFYVIQEGKVRVTDIVVGNISYEDVNLEAGDYFGEGALISSEPRAASVVAMTKGTAFGIDRNTVQKVLGNFTKLISKAQDRHKLEGIKIFRDSNLTAKIFDDLLSHLIEKKFQGGETIFKEGQRVDGALYLLRQGIVIISSSDGSRSEDILPGGYFGQEQLLADTQGNQKQAQYSATVGKDGCTCGVLWLKACRSVFDTRKMEDGLNAGGSAYKLRKRSSMITILEDLSMRDLTKEYILGEGQYAEVWLVSTNTKGQRREYALKIQNPDAGKGEENAMETFRREIVVLQQLHHPFIIDLIRTFDKDDGSLYLMLEAAKGGELWNRVHKEGKDGEWTSGMSEKHAKFYALCLADALAYIHREKFVFRDLKPENVLIDATGYPKIVDFGFAKYCPDKTYTFCGTPNYLAPEIVKNHGHGIGVDHWALGIVTYEMVTGENPFYFEDMDQISLFQAIVQDSFYPLAEDSNPDMVEFISTLLEKDPVQRLGVLAGQESDILRHKWFANLDLEKIRMKEVKAPWIPKLS